MLIEHEAALRFPIYPIHPNAGQIEGVLFLEQHRHAVQVKLQIRRLGLVKADQVTHARASCRTADTNPQRILSRHGLALHDGAHFRQGTGADVEGRLVHESGAGYLWPTMGVRVPS